MNDDTSRLKSGEIYLLQFYPYSFATVNSGIKYFLFNKIPVTIGTSAYDHLFFCRSFNIIPNKSLINGNKIKMTGVDLLYKTSRSKYLGGIVVSDTFWTKAIYVRLTVYNTA